MCSSDRGLLHLAVCILLMIDVRRLVQLHVPKPNVPGKHIRALVLLKPSVAASRLAELPSCALQDRRLGKSLSLWRSVALILFLKQARQAVSMSF